MFIVHFLLYQLMIKGFSADIDTSMEKLYMQFHGAINYILDTEMMRNVSHDVSFNLYTRKNPQVPQILPPSYPILIEISNFNPKLKTYFVIHGYTDHKHREIIARLRLELIKAEDCNVIVVDWGRIAALIYPTAVDNTVPVGTYVGEFLEILEHYLDLRRVHLIGHSLGAHISGIAGGHVGGRVGRITGLDPAGPLFELIEERDESQSLDKTDAYFVDVIHTDTDEFGITKPIGDADFYPNGGSSPQPGCAFLLISVSCSHIRSVEFYTESVNTDVPFEARQCNATDEKCLKQPPVHMGHHLQPDTRGVYFVDTNGEPPFAKPTVKK